MVMANLRDVKMRIVEASEHVKWSEWHAVYKTKAMLLGLEFGAISFTLMEEGSSTVQYDPDTLEPLTFEQRQDRFHKERGIAEFARWLKVTQGPQQSEGTGGNDETDKGGV